MSHTHQLSSISQSKVAHLDIKIDTRALNKRRFILDHETVTTALKDIHAIMGFPNNAMFDPEWLKITPEQEHVTFWKRHILVKTIADEVDEDGEPIFLYSLFGRAAWEGGNRDLDSFELDKDRFDVSDSSNGLCKFLTTDTFEEVANNRYELRIPESDLPLNVKIVRYYDQKDIPIPRNPFV